MFELVQQNLQMVPQKTLARTTTYHVVFMHSKFQSDYDDNYLIDMARSLEKFGHVVTIYTSSIKQLEIDCYENIQIANSGTWIPECLFGGFKKTLSRFRSLWMALSLIFFPPTPKPNIVVLDIDPIVLPLLHCFQNYKTVYIQHFPEIRSSEFFHCAMHMTPDLISAKALSYADEVVVQSKGLLNVFRRTYRKVRVHAMVLLPSYDTGLWKEESLNLKRLIPDLPKERILFVAFGEYKSRTNFKLIFDALDHLFSYANESIKEKIHFVIAGSSDEETLSQTLYYNDLVTKIKEKPFASQVTFLKNVPIPYQRTLIQECTAVVHPTRHDLYPGPILAAMSMGKPVITVNCGFPTEVMLHRLTGILVEPEPFKFAKVMVKLASSKTLQHYLSDMSYSHFCSSYSFDRLSIKFNNVIMKIMETDNALPK